MKHKRTPKVRLNCITINKLESGYTVKVSGYINEQFNESYHAVSTTK